MQVAVSAIYEISLITMEAKDIHVIASEVVDKNLRSLGAGLSSFASYRVVNSNGILAISQAPKQILDGFDAVFTLFGPLYTFRPPANSIVGFAQPWIIYPDNEVSHMLPLGRRTLERLKYWIQSRFFKQADLLVVELEHVRSGLVKHGIAKHNSVAVVHNALSSIYLQPGKWKPLPNLGVEADVKIGFLGRNYPHKNTGIFPEVHAELLRKHNINSKFLVTFTEDEWLACSDAFRACAVNIGVLHVAECPSFYEMLDAVIFPSLLECFSVTPLEAMAMERPLFASDRGFVRDVCGPYAHYFDPMNPEDVADRIAEYFHAKPPRAEDDLRAAKRHALNFSSPTERASEYLRLLHAVASRSTP